MHTGITDCQKKPPKNPPIKVLLITSILSMPLSLLPHTSTKEESDKPWALRQRHAATSMQQTLRGTAARGGAAGVPARLRRGLGLWQPLWQWPLRMCLGNLADTLTTARQGPDQIQATLSIFKKEPWTSSYQDRHITGLSFLFFISIFLNENCIIYKYPKKKKKKVGWILNSHSEILWTQIIH